jgi:hypothetical protein
MCQCSALYGKACWMHRDRHTGEFGLQYVASHSNSSRVTGQPHRITPVSRICNCNPSGKAEEQSSRAAKPLISARLAHSKSSPPVVTTREELAGRSGATLTCGTTAHGTHRRRRVRRALVCCAAASDVQGMRRACGLPKPEVRLKHCCCGAGRERDG